MPKYFWVDVVSTTSYVLNRMLIRPILKITPYELLKGKKPNVAHLKIFGCKCLVLNNGKENLGKFDSKPGEAIFVGYSLTSKAYRVLNRRTLNVEESMHVVFFMKLWTMRRIFLSQVKQMQVIKNILKKLLMKCT